MHPQTPPRTVPLNALSRHIAPLRTELEAAAARAIASGHYVLGPQVAGFETAFADYCGVAHCVGVGNGTDALELALKAVGVAPGDGVVLAANAAMYGTTAVLACGARPVFADILAEEATLDPDAVERAIAATPGVRALLITHLYGRLARVDALRRVADAHGVALVEDCAQAHGARGADGRRAGAYGDAAAFSFYPTKNLGALGDGGAVVCHDDAVASRLRSLRQYGWSSKYDNRLSGGRNSRLDELQAAMLSVLLPHLDAWNAARRNVAEAYAAGIRHPRIALPPMAGEAYVAHLYVVRSTDREALRVHLAEAGVQTDIHYPIPDHRQACLAGHAATQPLAQTERDAAEVLTLPCFPEMTDDEVATVVAACNRF